jgi:hypothetical protein
MGHLPLAVLVLVTAAISLVGVGGCGGGDELFVADDDDGGDDDSASGDDDDTTGRLGLLGRLGSATVDAAGYGGTEEQYLIADQGAGADVCRIRSQVTSTAPRDDCAECDWAWDLTTSATAIVAQSDVGCSGTLGVDETTVSQLDGRTLSYGYVDEYFGHASVMLVDDQGTWVVVSSARYDAGISLFEYDWEDATISY